MNKYFHNQIFFNNPNMLNCYWAGFIGADGSISNTNNCLKIGLAEKDTNHLTRFKNDIEFTGPISYRSKTKSSEIQIYGAQTLIYDLENCFNIVSNKSLTLKPPVELMFYDKELIKSYIVGYIDGDGCIKFDKRDKTFILDLYSGSLRIIKWFKYFLELEYPLKDKKIYSYGNGHLYRLQGKQALIVLSDLNKLDVPKLARKWDKLLTNSEGL